VPVLLSRGCGLVISPLKALMSQQVAVLGKPLRGP
jgi:superfamily II DNA helicase RecQ